MIRDTGAAAALLCGFLVAFLVYIALAPASGCNKYAAISSAYRTTILVDRGLREADPHVAAWVRRAAASCKAKHGAKTPGYKACFKPTADKARAFVAAGKTNRTAQDAIRAAHLGVGKANVTRIAAAAGCAALGAASVIGAFVPKVAEAATKLQAIGGVACGLSK